MELVEQSKMDDVLVFMGGIVPDRDIAELKRIGVKGIFLPGSSLNEIVNFVKRTSAKILRSVNFVFLCIVILAGGKGSDSGP